MFKTIFIRLLVVLIIILFSNSILFSFEPHFMKDPAISPSGNKICFSYKSDLWIVSYDGGVATRITSSPGEDNNPVFSNDGNMIAYNSNKDGYNAVYSIPATGGISKEVSKDGYSVVDWFEDDKSLLVTTYKYRTRVVYFKLFIDKREVLDLNISGDIYSHLGDNDSKIIFNWLGYSTREAYTGSRNGEIWEYDFNKDKYKKLTNTNFTERYPVYSEYDKKELDKDNVYFAASDGKIFQLYKAENYDFKNRKKLTNLKNWSVRDISIAKSNNRLVFEKFDELWKYNPKNDKVQKIEIEILEDFSLNPQKFSTGSNKDINNFAISDNGKLLAFIYKFDLFVVPTKGGEVIQVTNDQPGVLDLVIANDNKTIFYTAMDDKGNSLLFKTNVKDLEIIEKVNWSKNKYIESIEKNRSGYVTISYSVDEERNRIAIFDSLNTDVIEVIKDDVVWSSFETDKNLKYGFYSTISPDRWTRHLMLYDFKSKENINLFNNDGSLNGYKISDDCKTLLVNFNSGIARFDLVEKDDFYLEKDWWESVLEDKKKEDDKEGKDKKKDDDKDKKEKKEDSVKEIEITITKENVDTRFVKIITRNGRNRIIDFTTDSTFYYLNYNNDKIDLRKSDIFGKNDKSIYETKSSNFGNIIFNKKLGSLFLLNDNKISKFNIKSKKFETISFDFNYYYNKDILYDKTFSQIWKDFGRAFYDVNMHGNDWDEMYERYSNYMKYCNNGNEFQTIIGEMIGELNGSHSEFGAKKEKRVKNTYKRCGLGFELDFKNRPEKGICFEKVYRKSILNEVFNIKKGDKLLKVNNKEITRSTDIDPLFFNLTNKKIKLEIETKDSIKAIAFKGLSRGEHYGLFYDDWITDRKEMVDKISKNRIGYLHIRSMNGSSYNKFYQDLFANNFDKEALIIDVRRNGGGNTHDRLIEVLTKKQYAVGTNRFFGPEKLKTPGDVWDKPIILLMNEYSMSDAEIFPMLFREYKLGKIVGVETSGYVIGTYSNIEMLDGSRIRKPFHGWYKKDGTNLEGNGIKPDIEVRQSFNQLLDDDDVQLQRAVEEILKEVEKNNE